LATIHVNRKKKGQATTHRRGKRRGEEGMPMTAPSSMTAMVGVGGGTLAAPASFALAAKVGKQSCYSI